MRRWIIAATLAALAGCAKAEMDAEGAAALATSIGDTEGAACYSALEPLVAAPPTGVLSGYEVGRGVSIIATGPCASVFAGLALHVLNKIPGAP